VQRLLPLPPLLQARYATLTEAATGSNFVLVRPDLKGSSNIVLGRPELELVQAHDDPRFKKAWEDTSEYIKTAYVQNVAGSEREGQLGKIRHRLRHSCRDCRQSPQYIIPAACPRHCQQGQVKGKGRSC
jgi:hypothetical protein